MLRQNASAVSEWCAGANAASKSPQSSVAKADSHTGLHDGMANPEVYKHVEITKQLATLFGVSKPDQVFAVLSMFNGCCNNCMYAAVEAASKQHRYTNTKPPCFQKMTHVLGCQVLGQAEKVVSRLKRLDEVMPKYQHVAGQLYDLLRVRGLDDVLPAVQALVS